MLIVLLCFFQAVLYAQLQTGSFEFEGYERNYLVFLPQNFQPNMPVVFNLHGYTDNAQWQMNYSLMNEVADTAGFIVVYPNAIYPGFNTGLVYGSWPSLPTNVDDVGFISALIDTIESQYDVDLNRVYCCGLSNGGMMTLKLACQLRHRFAAFGSVSGVLLDPIAANYSLVGSVPMLLCHGTGDVLVHYNGGPYPMMWSVEETLDFWIQNNNCVLTPDTVAIPDTCLLDSSYVQKICYTNCVDSVQVVLYKIINGGHCWPSGNQNITWGTEGNKNRDINANIELWNFFKNYENPLINMAYGKSLEVTPSYFPTPVNDTIIIRANLNNPEDHPLTVNAMIRGYNTDFQDSLELFDDGLHGDGNENDLLFGSKKWLSDLEEDIYTVELSTEDHTEGTTQYYHIKQEFTTTGPVIVQSYSFTTSDSIPNPGDRLYLFIELRNMSEVTILSEVSARLVSLDTMTSVLVSKRDFAVMEPEGTSQNDAAFSFEISEYCPVGTEIQFEVDIASLGYYLWSDTFSILVQEKPVVNAIDNTEEALISIYPNPANDFLNILFQADCTGIATIEMMDITGEMVFFETFRSVSASDVYRVDISKYQEGMYLMVIRNDKFTETYKIINSY